MIKLIATDLDGTLLDEKRSLPPQIFPLVERLHAHGVLFVPASGRQYANLKKLFAPVADKVFFLCENGALVKHREKTLFLRAIDDAQIKRALDEIRALPHIFPMLCGVDCAYIESDAEPFSSLSFASYTHCRRVNNLDDVIGKEPVCKIAIYDEISAADNCMRTLPQRLPALRTMQSGFDWCDVSAPDCHKGNAIAYLCDAFSLKREECVAFGDHMNDYEMLRACGTAYVPANAFPPLIEAFGNVVPPNREGGVIQKCMEILAKIEGEQR